uniref:Uncharacterized protein n=1 Tax=Oryza barthii TaxID=65489 RepID=A0A0D3FUJ1_9ORYZ
MLRFDCQGHLQFGDIFKKVLAEGHKWENPKELDKISDSIGDHFAKVAVSVDKRAYYQKLR